MADKQPPLIQNKDIPSSGRLDSNTSLQAAIGLFEKHMEKEGFSIHTVKAFMSDIRLLAKFIGYGTSIGAIGEKDLNDFLHWLKFDRGVPCSAKTYARRVTTLKVFFSWLQKDEVLAINPASGVVQETAKSPLPTPPTDAQIAEAQKVTEAWRKGEGVAKRDARPSLLINLLLQTGIKKGEAMAIVPNHFQRDNEPVVHIRYKNPKSRYKERNIDIEPELIDVLDEYLVQYDPKETLFTCTARNLEYILRDVGDEAGLPKGTLSFENLRWASAYREYVATGSEDKIRDRLGLSKVTWRDTKAKLKRLQELDESG